MTIGPADQVRARGVEKTKASVEARADLIHRAGQGLLSRGSRAIKAHLDAHDVDFAKPSGTKLRIMSIDPSVASGIAAILGSSLNELVQSKNFPRDGELATLVKPLADLLQKQGYRAVFFIDVVEDYHPAEPGPDKHFLAVTLLPLEGTRD